MKFKFKPKKAIPKVPVNGVGFQVVTEILLEPHLEWVALECDEETLRKEMSSAFLEVLQVKVPETAEALGYQIHTLQVGVNVLTMKPMEDSPEDEKSLK